MTFKTTALVLALALVATPLAAEAQQAGRVPRVGFLGAVTPEDFPHPDEGFRRGLREFGYVEGQNIVIDPRGLTCFVARASSWGRS